MTDVAPCRLLKRFLSAPRMSGTCANDRRRRAERLEQEHVLRRVRDVIVASNHVRDLHLHIVDDDREVVGGVAVRAEDARSLRCWRNRTRFGRGRHRQRQCVLPGTLKRIARGVPAASSAATRSGVKAQGRSDRTATPRPAVRAFSRSDRKAFG